jgi:hypothetical protein
MSGRVRRTRLEGSRYDIATHQNNGQGGGGRGDFIRVEVHWRCGAAPCKEEYYYGRDAQAPTNTAELAEAMAYTQHVERLASYLHMHLNSDIFPDLDVNDNGVASLPLPKPQGVQIKKSWLTRLLLYIGALRPVHAKPRQPAERPM